MTTLLLKGKRGGLTIAGKIKREMGKILTQSTPQQKQQRLKILKKY